MMSGARKDTLSEALEGAPVELTVLSSGTIAEGARLQVAGDVRVDGQVLVEELVVGRRLIVAERGVVAAKHVQAEDAIVSGEMRGTFHVESTLVIKDAGCVDGTIHTGRLIVEDGGVCNGVLRVGQSFSGTFSGPKTPSRSQASAPAEKPAEATPGTADA